MLAYGIGRDQLNQSAVIRHKSTGCSTLAFLCSYGSIDLQDSLADAVDGTGAAPVRLYRGFGRGIRYVLQSLIVFSLPWLHKYLAPSPRCFRGNGGEHEQSLIEVTCSQEEANSSSSLTPRTARMKATSSSRPRMLRRRR